LPVPHCAVVVQGQVSHCPLSLQHWPALQSVLLLQTGAPVEPPAPVEHEEQAPLTQHFPAIEPAQSALAAQAQGPQLRVSGSQHCPALQSSFEAQQGAQDPPWQHSPAPHWASVQQAACWQVPLAWQHSPAGQSPWAGAPVQLHAPQLRVSGLQHCPALQSWLLAQQSDAHWLSRQH
jgi:hypothetical protein